MADFRAIYTRMWKDEWFSGLPIDAKLLFVYLFSNERASICGMYELPIRFMAFETGLDEARVSEILDDFQAAKKVYYRDGVVWVVNLRKYNETPSGKVFGRIVKDIESIPDGWVKAQYCKSYSIPYRYPIETRPQTQDTHPQNDSDTDTDTETLYRYRYGDEKPIEDTPPSISPEIDLYREVTGGLTPDYMREDEIKRNVQAVRMRLKYPPREQVRDYLSQKYSQWCACVTQDGKPYNPTNPKWLEWCVTDYTPKPAKPPPDPERERLAAARASILGGRV